MNTRVIDSGWTLSAPSAVPYHRPQFHEFPEIPATVPGHVHVDLIHAGLIVDPFTGMAEAAAQWVGETDWTYRCTFDWQPNPAFPHRVLRFGGIDTVATVFLNGEEIAQADNFFLPLEVDVTSRLRPGQNQIEVQILSAVKVGEERRTAYFAQEGLPTDTLWFDEGAFVRKPAYMSGWDWGPRLVSSGIWKPVELLEFADRIVECSVLTERLADGRYRLKLDATTEGEATLRATANGLPFDADGTLDLTADAWWPNGEGVASMVDVEVTFGDHRIHKRVGLRTIKLLRKPDQWGTSFEFEVNGRRVWARGANWIPHHSFPSVVTREDVFAAVAKYAKLGMNMLRVWGGGLYETEDFYDACDTHGIMVWQDFPYACGLYPDDDAAQATARREADYHIRRVRDRACHVLWCGNNENRALYFGKWSGPGTLAPRFFGEVIYNEVLLDCVRRGDPGKDYIESSPLLVKPMSGHEDATLNSDDHYWDVWHGRGDWVYYRESDTRFSSEFGFASSCTASAWESVAPALTDHESPIVRWHDKTNKPWPVFREMVELHYPRATNLLEWIYSSQLNQRDALRAAFEHYRMNPACRGALIWQANDCWPVQSWAIEDFARLLKPDGFEMARLLAPVLISAHIEGGKLRIGVCNDSQKRVDGAIQVNFVDTLSGQIIRKETGRCEVAPDARGITMDLDVHGLPATRTSFCVSLEGNTIPRWGLLCEPKNAVLQAAPLNVRSHDGKWHITPQGFVFDLVFAADAPLADTRGLAGTQAFTAMPGETIVVTTEADPRSLQARSLAGLHPIQMENRADTGAQG